MTEMPTVEGGYSVIYADPPWPYSFSRSRSRKVENQYPTMTIGEIMDMPIESIVAKDAALFLWATAPKLMLALDVMNAWGFEYITNAVWDKLLMGPGYWFRTQHEHLLIGRRNKIHCPAPSIRQRSIWPIKRTEHSKKPVEYREWITKAYPTEQKIELFAREQIPYAASQRWAVWGDEV